MNKKQVIELYKSILRIRQKPKTIQMPITSRCNSKCKTCNIWKHSNNKDIDANELKYALRDSFFNEVSSVGINGGEFTLVPNFLEIIGAVLILPNLKDIYLITNGLSPKRLFKYTQQAHTICKQKGVNMHLCLSVDGVGEIHEVVRGVPKCFDKTKEILDIMQKEGYKYCSEFSVSCTISVHNVDYIRQTQQFLNSYPELRVEYHCAIPNKRIKTFNNADYYVANDDRKRLLLAQFFYEQYLCSYSVHDKCQNFANYYFLKNGCKNRINVCSYRNRDVTIDEQLNLSLCATASNIIGNLKDKKASKLIRSKQAKIVAKEVRKYCKNCGHYSYHPLNFYGRIVYIGELLRQDYLYEYFKIHSIRSSIVRKRKLLLLYVKVLIRTIIYLYRFIWKLQ